MNRFNSRSSLFLLEIMLAVLFFSIAGALCLQMFSKSRQIGEDTANLTQAAEHVRNAAELIKYTADPSVSGTGDAVFPDCLLTEYPAALIRSDKVQVYFDENWNCCLKEHGIYCMEAVPSQSETPGLFCCQFTVYKTDGGISIYSLDFKLHIPN